MNHPPLEKWRLEKGLTYAQVAGMFGVHTATAHRWCVGLGVPRPGQVKALMKRTGLPLEAIRPPQAQRSAA